MQTHEERKTNRHCNLLGQLSSICSQWNLKEDSSSDASPERRSVSDGAAADGGIDRRNKWKARIARSKEMESFPMDEWVLS